MAGGKGNGGEGRDPASNVRDPAFLPAGCCDIVRGRCGVHNLLFLPRGLDDRTKRLRVGAWCGLFVACDNGHPEQGQGQGHNISIFVLSSLLLVIILLLSWGTLNYVLPRSHPHTRVTECWRFGAIGHYP